MKKLKPAKFDYTPGMLPQNRKQLFWDVVKLQWTKLLLLGLLLLLFALPLLFSTFVKDVYISNLYQALENAGADQQAQAGQSLIYLDVIRSAIHILLLGVFSVALAGAGRVIRQLAWGENVHLPTDLAKGIRNDLGQTAGICMLAGLIYTLCLMLYYSAGNYGSSLLGSFSLLPVAISLFLVLPVLSMALPMLPIYSNRFSQLLKNAFYVYTRTLLKNLLALLCTALIWVPALIPNFYCHILGGVLGLMLTPFALLGWTLYCYNRFDLFLNPQVAPELIGKGIYHPAE